MFFKKNKKKKEKKFRFRLFGSKEGTVAEPWTSAEELFEIYKEGRKKIQAIIKKNGNSK